MNEFGTQLGGAFLRNITGSRLFYISSISVLETSDHSVFSSCLLNLGRARSRFRRNGFWFRTKFFWTSDPSMHGYVTSFSLIFALRCPSWMPSTTSQIMDASRNSLKRAWLLVTSHGALKLDVYCSYYCAHGIQYAIGSRYGVLYHISD